MELIKILLIDDEKAILEATKTYLKQMACDLDITTCTSSKKALNLLAKNEFDIVISDYQMPEMNGLELLQKIRESDSKITFIMMTGKGREEVAIKALNLGADFYLQKGKDTKSQFRELLNLVDKSIDKKVSEKALDENRNLFYLLASNVSDVITIIDFDFKAVYVSPSSEKLFGYPPEEFIQLSYQDFLTPESIIELEKHIAELMEKINQPTVNIEKTRTVALEVIRKDGSKIWTEAKFNYMQDSKKNLTGLLNVMRDISHRKKAEQSLILERESFRLIAETAVSTASFSEICNTVLGNLIKTIDFNYGSIRIYNEKTGILSPIATYGFTKHEKDLLKDQHIDDEGNISCYVARTRKPLIANNIRDLPEMKQFSKRIKEFDLQTLIIWPIISSKDDLIGVFSTSIRGQRDIPEENWQFFETMFKFVATILERKFTETKLRESEERFRKLFETSPLPIVYTDLAGNLILANKQALDLFGYDNISNLIGQSILPRYADEEEQRVSEFLTKRTKSDSILETTFKLRKKNGTNFIGSISSAVIHNSEGKPAGYFGVIQDMTNRIKVQQTISEHQEELQRQKDELEFFASTIAHDLRGKLQVISMYNELDKGEYSQKIDDQIQEISVFIENLLFLAKEGEILGDIKTVKLSSLFQEILEDIKSLDKKLEIQLKKLPTIKADPVKLMQVFENLLMNVIKHASATQLKIYAKKNDKFLHIFINDNGKGMNEEKQAEIRKLLKEQSYHPTGLLIALKIIKAHKGYLTFESKENVGTTFKVSLPF